MMQKKLDRILKTLTQQNKFSGVALLTKGKETIFSGAYGYANRPWKIPNHLGVRFDTASLTKLFTTVAILQLIEQKHLSFSTQAIPFLGLTDTAISDEVTVFHLLTHSSGIGDDADEEVGESYEDLWKEKPNYSVTETAHFLPQFIHKPPNFPPGQGCRYNNVGFVLLGLIIEKITGLSYRNYIRQNIFAKVGMTQSDFFKFDGVYENVAEGYTPLTDKNRKVIGWHKNIYAYPPIGSPDSGAYTTSADLDLFIRTINRGDLLSKALTKDLLSPKVFYFKRDGYERHYGYGFLFVLNPQKEVMFYVGQGENAGVSCKSVYYPATDMHLVLLANQDFCTWNIVWDVHEMLTK